MLRSYRIVGRNWADLAYLSITAASYAGLFAWISGSAFVLQDLYGLAPFDFGVAFALGSVGYIDRLGNCRPACHSPRTGWGPRIRRLRLRCRGAGDGRRSCVRTCVLHVAGSSHGGLSCRPRHGAAAGHRRRDDAVSRTGRAASSLFGFLQQTAAAVCGAAVGWFLGQSAWPLALGVATMGFATLGLWLATRGLRSQAAKH